MKRTIAAALLVLPGMIPCLHPGIARADADGERAALARLIHEIDALEPLIRDAELQADATKRIRFQYGWLRQDLQRVKLGIAAHTDAPRAEPREFPPLKGDYRR